MPDAKGRFSGGLDSPEDLCHPVPGLAGVADKRRRWFSIVGEVIMGNRDKGGKEERKKAKLTPKEKRKLKKEKKK